MIRFTCLSNSRPMAKRSPAISTGKNLMPRSVGMSTSMKVELTVNLLKRQATRLPRAENDEYLMSLGIGNSLEDALRAATTQLADWLRRDYKLSPNDAAIVLGTAVQYNIAEVVDPLVHVVAKV